MLMRRDVPQIGFMLRELFASLLLAITAVAHAQGVAPRADVPEVRVGDYWKWENRSGYNGLRESEISRTVTSVTSTEIRGNENAGEFTMTTDLSVTQTPTFTILEGKSVQMNFPLEIGKRWRTENTFGSASGVRRGRNSYDVRVLAYEKIKVPAGEFDAFKIESIGTWTNYRTNSSGPGRAVWWYAPVVKNIIKWDYRDMSFNSVQELVEYRVTP